MAGWTEVRLDECCNIISGATPSTTTRDYWGGDICWATPKDLSELDGAVIADTPRKITEAGLASCAAEVLPVGSVLFSSRAPIGHVAINAVPMATNQGFKSFVPKHDRIEARYLYWWLRTHRTYMESLGNGATFKEVSKAVVARVRIPLPPLVEQRRIAEVLDRAESLRAKRRSTLVLMSEMHEANLVALFGEAVANPMRWPRIALGELIVDGPQNGLYKPASDYGSGTPILRIDAFYDGAITKLASLKRVRVDTEEITKYGLRQDDIIINRVNSLEYLGKTARVPALDEPTVFESNMMRFTVNQSRVDPCYLIQFLQTRFVAGQVRSAAKKAVNQASINQRDVRGILINLPPISLQREFRSRVEAIDALHVSLIASLERIDELVASLQHRAFRGEL